MVIASLMLLLSVQAPVIGPTPPSGKNAVVVPRTNDGSVLGAIGARDANMIEVAKLATTKASNGEAKSLAALVLKDHQLSLTAGANLAKELHITRLLPADSAMARAQVDEMAALNALSGAAFDRAFVQFIVDDHKAAIVKVTGVEPALATRASVKAFVRRRLPTLQAHQLAAEKWLAKYPSPG